MTFDIPAGTPLVPCRGCGKRVAWIITKAGKRMPVDQDGISHFATCTEADYFRTKGKPHDDHPAHRA